MSNIIDSIQLSGVTYTLSAETSGGGITSGEVQTMIDTSISGKVNVSDNEVSGLTVKNYIFDKNKHPYGEITDFWIVNNSTVGSYSSCNFESITSGGVTSSCNIYYRLSGTVITTVISTSGNFTYELVDGKIHITFNEGYSFYRLAQYLNKEVYYTNEYQGGQSADVIEGGVNEALNDISERIIENPLTAAAITIQDNKLILIYYPNNGDSEKSSRYLYDNKTLKYVNNEGLHVSFSASTPTLEYFNYGSDVHWTCPSYPIYNDSYDSLIISFNSDYTGSTTSYDLIVYTINSGGTRQSDTYTYDTSNYTLTFKSGSNITDFVMDGYNAVFTIKEGNSGLKMNCVAQYDGQIIGVDAVDKSPYSITGVSTPTYDYNGQDIIDDIYTKLGGKQDTLSAGTGISISGNVISATGSSIEVSSAITSGDTNAVAGGAVYNKFDEVEQVTARALIHLNEKKQDTLSAGTGIEISGNVISTTGGGGGNPTVELTQAEYDALVSAGTVSADTYYIITDAYSPDISSITSAVTSGSTDSEIPTAKAVYDAIPTVTNTITSGSTDAISAGAVYDALGDVETLLSQI